MPAACFQEQPFIQLRAELERHAHAEEQMFYPVLQGVDATREMMEEARDDHQLVAELLQELATTPKGSAEWLAFLSPRIR